MSSGWNGITIPTVGHIRRKLAEMLCQRTSFLFEAHKLKRTNPINQKWEDCCAWDTYAIATSSTGHRERHFYSWDCMRECAKGFIITHEGRRFSQWSFDNVYDFEVFAYNGEREAMQAKCTHEWIERDLREKTFNVRWGTVRHCFWCGLMQIADDTRQWGAGSWKPYEPDKSRKADL